MKITQNAQSAGSQQGMMKFMTYGMPLMFFFIFNEYASATSSYELVNNYDTIEILEDQKLTVKISESFEYEDDRVWKTINILYFPELEKYKEDVQFTLREEIVEAFLDFS